MTYGKKKKLKRKSVKTVKNRPDTNGDGGDYIVQQMGEATGGCDKEKCPGGGCGATADAPTPPGPLPPGDMAAGDQACRPCNAPSRTPPSRSSIIDCIIFVAICR